MQEMYLKSSKSKNSFAIDLCLDSQGKGYYIVKEKSAA